MKWKEPTFGATPMLKALTTANAHRKAQAFDLAAEQKKQKLNYPDWAQTWMRKYKEDWYIAQANGDEVGMRKAQKLAEGLRSKLREMATFPKWAQEQMQKETVRWMTAEASGDIMEKLAAEKAGRALREKLGLIDTSAKSPSQDTKKTEEAKPLNIPKTNELEIGKGDKSSFGSVAEFKKKYGDVIKKLGAELNVDPNLLGAVILVESGGSGFVNGKLKIRFEVHHFVKYPTSLFSFGKPTYKEHRYRENPKMEWKKVHTGKQSSEYDTLNFAITQNEEKAYRAISMGLTQILGSNYNALGYKSAKEMFQKFSTGHEEQIKGFVLFIKDANLVKKLQKNDLRGFVSGYNGKGNIEHYTKKLKENTSLYKNS
ncbi:N-acetylmuramidase domain-containing protein [Paenibacillus polymyxa]|uniref:N-acetylmuramidase domain-containing protein n=1 Tax=Paenibacillus polymyxa TaxID=1406 RepID=UPI00234B631C|nr:N-acetylmuramidase domain-containing protein [Paenibacillus polymyxa]WCM61100.1 N-acetylmuramidase domain-containing protein [Paenibacillus polymyxa]